MPPPGDSKLDQEIVARIFLKVRELYQKEGGKFPDAILNAYLDLHQSHNPSLAEVAKEINGKALADLKDEKQTPQNGRPDSSCPALHGCAMTAPRLWQLALLRLLDGSRLQFAAARYRRSFRSGHLSELGLVVAGEPPRHVQPRFLRSRRQALGSQPQAGLVE